MALDFFYDNQIRRYLIQATRVFGQFSYQYKNSQNQNVTKRIPATLASQNFNVAAMTTDNTENFAQTVPQFSIYLRDVQMDAESRQTPNFERYLQVAERQIDEDTDEYTGNCGNRYTVQSYMPVPYRMVITVYLWTSNLDQKCQIMEQILAIFNPGISLQSNTNPLDWTSLTYLEMTNIQWTNNSYPLANQSVVELATMDFFMPIWINAPSKVKQQKLIEKIITSLGDVNNLIEDTTGDLWINDDELYGKVCVTYNDYGITVLDTDKVKLVNSDNGLYNSDGSVPSWKKLVDETGTYTSGKSKLLLTYEYNEIDVEVSGLFYFTEEENIIDIDFINYPTPSYIINGIIDPQQTNPESKLSSAKEGDTYLIIREIDNNYGFNGLSAKINDIIYFDGDNWLVKISPTNSIVIYNDRSARYFVWDGKNWDDLFFGSKKNINWGFEL